MFIHFLLYFLLQFSTMFQNSLKNKNKQLCNKLLPSPQMANIKTHVVNTEKYLKVPGLYFLNEQPESIKFIFNLFNVTPLRT